MRDVGNLGEAFLYAERLGPHAKHVIRRGLLQAMGHVNRELAAGGDLEVDFLRFAEILEQCVGTAGQVEGLLDTTLPETLASDLVRAGLDNPGAQEACRDQALLRALLEGAFANLTKGLLRDSPNEDWLPL